MDLDLREGWDRLEGWVLRERLGRRKYVQTIVLTLVIGFAVILSPFLLFFVLPDFNSDFLTLPIAAVGIAVAIVMILVYSAASVARLRDMGKPTNLFIVGFIPYVNVVFFIVLALAEGKASKELSSKKKEGEKRGK